METPPVTPTHVLNDAGIAIGSVVVPIYVYQISAIAGATAAVLGAFLVFVKLMLAIRDWRRG